MDSIKVINAARLVCTKCGGSCVRLAGHEGVCACYNPGCENFSKAFKVPEVHAVRCPEWDTEFVKLYRGHSDEQARLAERSILG